MRPHDAVEFECVVVGLNILIITTDKEGNTYIGFLNVPWLEACTSE